MNRFVLKAALVLVLAVFLWVDSTRAAPVIISYSAISPSSASTWMAEEIGAFKKHGLDVQLIYISSSGTNVQALLGGSLHFAGTGATGVVTAAARGADIVAVASGMNRPPVTLYVQPEINKVEDLRGKSLAISSFGSSGHAVTVLVLRKFGLEKDVSLRAVGGVPQRQAAFEQKVVAGFMTLVRPKGAARALLNAADLDIPLGYNWFTTTRKYARENPDTVLRVLRALVEGAGALVHEKERTIKMLSRYLNRTDRPFLEESYEIARKYTDRIPQVDTRSVATVLESSNIKDVKPEALAEQFIDNSFVDRLAKEKFLEKVFGKDLR
ncbi:MAG: ABC transporter substrate-binding protein [Deltaproteobacteria bacterium]|nr:ABC transporter substrate-binding protein [Deltaproteobacteria bacterium]